MCWCVIVYGVQKDLSRSIFQSSGGRMLSQLRLFVGCIFGRIGSVYVDFGELRLSRWRFTGVGVTAESAAGYTRAASPLATDNCCYTIITITDYYHIPLHYTNPSASSSTPTSTHSWARADTYHTSPTSHNTANMVLEATMIVYVLLSPEAPTEPRT